MTDALPPGSECIIRALPEEPRLAQRLAELGVLPGSRLHILRRSPLGETVEVAAEQGQNLALRADELAALHCEPVATPLLHAPLAAGRCYRVLRLEGGPAFRQRMERQGITAGSDLELSADTPQLQVRTAGGRDIRLGRGEAAKIIVALPAAREGC